MQRPAIVSVPAAFLAMVIVSVATAKRRARSDADQLLLRLHAPERLGLTRDRSTERADHPIVQRSPGECARDGGVVTRA